MGIQGPYKVEADELLPFGHGLVGAVLPSRDYNRSTREQQVQEVDPDTGYPVWVVDVMDFDPEARERTFRVKIAAPVQPVPPDEMPGVPVRPVHLDGLTIRTYPKEAGTDRRTKQTRYTMGFTVWATGFVRAALRREGLVEFVVELVLWLVRFVRVVGFVWVVGFRFVQGGLTMATSTWNGTAAGLRAWARGDYPMEAAVELLARAFGGRFASVDWPWIQRGDVSGWYWIDLDAIASGSGMLSGGERRLLAVVAALVGAPLADLGGTVAGLDRDNLALVLAALAHAGGSHEHRLLRLTAAGPALDQPGPLVDWPASDDGLGVAG